MKLDRKSLEIVAQLRALNLSRREAEVYLALLRQGEGTTGPLLRATGLHGQYVYAALERLEKLGLVQHVVVRGWRRYRANHPRAIVHLAERQRLDAERTLALLETSLVLPSEQDLEVFRGREAYLANEYELLDRAPVDGVLCVIGGEGDRFSERLGSDLAAYEARRRAKRLRVRYLGAHTQRVTLAPAMQRRFLFDARVLPGLSTGVVNTNIWPNAVNLNVFGDPVVSIRLVNAPVVESYRCFFETLWAMSEEVR